MNCDVATSELGPDLAVITLPVAALLPYAENARTHSDAQVAQIAGSIAEFGFVNPVLVDAAGVLVAGHGRLLAAQRLGMTAVPAIRLAHLTEPQARALRLADNQIALNSGWDEALLATEIARIRDEAVVALDVLGFSGMELDRLLAEATSAVDAGHPRDQDAPAGAEGATCGAGDEEGEAPDDPADAAPVAPRAAVARPGDIWCLGEHRLACGDSTDPTTVARLMRDDRAALLFTSPPYGNQREYTTGGISDWDALMRGVFGTLDHAVARDAQLLVNLGLIHRDGEWQPYWSGWLDWMRAQGWRRFGLYTWDQGPGLPGDWNGRLSPAFELVFHFNREARRPNKIIPCRWAGHVNSEKGGLRAKDGTVGEWQHAGQGVQETRIPDSVLRITRHKARGIETEHPAVFPVALPEFLMRAYSDEGDVVFEPFGGAGTSIIAGQRTGRRLRAIELAPAYVDLAIARWRMLFPDQPVTLDNGGFGDGQDYDAVTAERVKELADAA